MPQSQTSWLYESSAPHYTVLGSGGHVLTRTVFKGFIIIKLFSHWLCTCCSPLLCELGTEQCSNKGGLITNHYKEKK